MPTLTFTSLILLALATTGIVNAVHSAVIFEGWRQWLLRREHVPGVWRTTRWLIAGIKCSYCFAHWVAAPLVLLVAPFDWPSIVLYFAVVWVSHHFKVAFEILLQVKPLMDVIGHTHAQALQQGLPQQQQSQQPPQSQQQQQPPQDSHRVA